MKHRRRDGRNEKVVKINNSDVSREGQYYQLICFVRLYTLIRTAIKRNAHKHEYVDTDEEKQIGWMKMWNKNGGIDDGITRELEGEERELIKES